MIWEETKSITVEADKILRPKMFLAFFPQTTSFDSKKNKELIGNQNDNLITIK